MSTLPKTDRLKNDSPLFSQRIFSPKRYSVFDDVDKMVKNARLSLKRSPPLSLWDGNIPKNFEFNCIPEFNVTEDDKAFTVVTSVSNYEKKDIVLNFDHDKRMLRLTGKKHYKEGDMQVESSFEKAISLSHDIDASKLDATLSDGTLTITAPKKLTLDEQFSEATTAALEEDAAEDEIVLSTGGMVA
ncbi:hypothetical protein ACHAWT_000213 [Skeletonema menzelii]